MTPTIQLGGPPYKINLSDIILSREHIYENIKLEKIMNQSPQEEESNVITMCDSDTKVETIKGFSVD